MSCCQYFAPTEAGSTAFTVQMPKLTFGRGSLAEVGPRVAMRGLKRIGLFTDAWVRSTGHFEQLTGSLDAAGVDWAAFDSIRVEPNDRSIEPAARFLAEGGFDGVVSLGGGSVMDTAKAAMVYARYPASFTDYFAPPIGAGVAVPGPVLPHIACPTTAGTGSEMTGLSVIRIEALETKFVIASRHIMPDEAIIDPACLDTVAPNIVASSGFDLLSHAIECYTARAYTRWAHVDAPAARPQVQGANPWSDLHAREALDLAGRYLTRAVADTTDHEARDSMSWAATLAGMAFGNCGTHLPHGLSYGVTNLVRGFRARDYPGDTETFLPHGISVIVTSPSVFRFTATAAPTRHLEAARQLGARTDGAAPEDAGEITAGRIIELMRATGMPNGLGGVGFVAADAGPLARSAMRQGRAIGNAPRDTGESDVEGIFERAMSYW